MILSWQRIKRELITLWLVMAMFWIINLGLSVTFVRFILYPLFTAGTYNIATILTLSVMLTFWQFAVLFMQYMLFTHFAHKLVLDLFTAIKLGLSSNKETQS